LELDRVNGNTMWTDAEMTGLNQIDEHKSFIDKGVECNPGSDCKRIRVHMAHAVKHDGRHKARLAAGGHLAGTPVDSACSSVVSLRGARLLASTGELNDLKIWSTDVGNAHLETHTEENVCVIAGPEFGDREGHVLITSKAPCGLSERLEDCLREMGFFTSKCEKDIWMRDKGDHCEHIAVCVDDLLIASKDPDSIVKLLMETCQFKLKGTGPTKFHLGCDFFRDEEGAPCCAPKKHIEKILDNCRWIFGTWPGPATSPPVNGDHPELDTSELLNEDDQKTHQSLIGAPQWVIQIDRLGIQTAVVSLSRFRTVPR